MIQKPEPNSFKEVEGELTNIIKLAFNKFKDHEYAKNYDTTKCNDLSKMIIKQIMDTCTTTYPSFKFCCSCVAINKKEGGVHMTSSCYWDASTDGNIQMEEDTDALKLCVSLFALF